MKILIQILLDYWPLLSPVIYEMIVRIWPTRWNVSILDNAWKIVNAIIPNKRVPDGNESGLGTDARGRVVNKIKVKMGRHVLRSLLIVFLFSVSANAQIWQNFKGVRLVNESDTSAQLAIEGSIFYDDDSRNFYGRDQWGWKPLIGGGGGGGYAFSNGITENPPGVVKFGGALTASSSLLVPGGFYLDLGGDEGAVSITSADAGLNPGAIITDLSNVFGYGAGMYVLDNRATSKGLEYYADYSADFTDRSHADWGNVWRAKGTTTLKGNSIIDGASTRSLDFDNLTNLNIDVVNGGQINLNTDGSLVRMQDITTTKLIIFDPENLNIRSRREDGTAAESFTVQSADGGATVTDADNLILRGGDGIAGGDGGNLTIQAGDGEGAGINGLIYSISDSVTFHNSTSDHIVISNDVAGTGLQRITFKDGTNRIAYIDYSSTDNWLDIGRGGQALIRINNNNEIIFPALRTTCVGASSGSVWNDTGTLKICP